MRRLTRGRLLKTGATGAAAAGVALAAPGVAKADDDDAFFIHIDGVVSSPTAGTLVIDVDVAGTRDDLDGDGWDTDFPGEGSADWCLFTQHGTFHEKTIDVQGKSVVNGADNPDFLNQTVITRMNTSTGAIFFQFGPFEFNGTGKTIIVEAKKKPESDD